MAETKKTSKPPEARSYRHPTAESLLRPEVGTQAQFRKKKPPVTYRYDSSLDPTMSWDEGNVAREEGETLIRQILESESLEGAKAAASKLKAMSSPFLNWCGKAERIEFEVPTFPLFVHERLSTKAIIETLRGHKQTLDQLQLFGDPQHSIADQVLKAYEHRDKWVNRMILGDSLVVMSSLLHYEGMGGQVQMIYMDPPYGVKFGSNFQPFVRKRDVKHGDDDHMTYEPEMVQAYRDTWEFGLHSWLTYMRDRVYLARELLSSAGSLFVQISDQNIHHLRGVLDEVFGGTNFVAIVDFVRTSGLASADRPATACDYLLWYAKSRLQLKFRRLFVPRDPGSAGSSMYSWIEEPAGTRRSMTKEEREGRVPLADDVRRYRLDNLTKPGPGRKFAFEFEGITYTPGKRWWGTTPEGMAALATASRLQATGATLSFVRFWDDFAWQPLTTLWSDTASGGFAEEKLYVVQTPPKVIERCMLMTTDPGDLVFDPTCGSGTTAYVAEQWGRRWITNDVSRVPLALVRQRLLTATFDYYELKDESRGPASGFVYKRKQNRKSEEVGGIVPHITLKSIANNEPPAQEVLFDRPEVLRNITRVTGPFVVEATMPTPMDWETATGEGGEVREEHAVFGDRMLEVLRKVRTLRLPGNRRVELKNVRLPARTLTLSAEAVVNGEKSDAADLSGKAVAFVFGPENGAVSERLVFEAAREAHGKNYAHLFVLGFGIEPNARLLVEKCLEVMGIAATYVEATRDLLMGDLLKNLRSSQVFSVCGLPDAVVQRAKDGKYQVKLLGVDVFDPVTMTSESRPGDDVPAWFLDTDYNGRVFHVCQAFFPRTAAWENLKKALKADYSAEIWDHLSGTTSAPFEKGDHGQIAVKVIDDRGNELLVVKSLGEAER